MVLELCLWQSRGDCNTDQCLCYLHREGSSTANCSAATGQVRTKEITATPSVIRFTASYGIWAGLANQPDIALATSSRKQEAFNRFRDRLSAQSNPD